MCSATPRSAAPSGGKPVVGFGDDHTSDRDALLAQHVQGRHAEMAGADESDPHNVSSVLSLRFSVDNMPGRPVTHPRPGRRGYQQGRQITLPP